MMKRVEILISGAALVLFPALPAPLFGDISGEHWMKDYYAQEHN